MSSIPIVSSGKDTERVINARHGGLVWLENGQRSRCLDFSANVWPYPLDRSAFKDCISNLDAYPDPEYQGLVSAAARYYGVDPSQVFPANGSTEALYLAMLTLKPRKVAIFEPTFSEYEKAARWATSSSVDIVRILGNAADNFRAELSVPDADVAVLCNPNNPTGAYFPRKELAHWLDACLSKGLLVIIDEAFIEFVEDPNASMAAELRERPNLLLLRSMTKYFGIPGVRLGFALGSRELIVRIRENRIPWSVSTMAQQMGTYLALNSGSPAAVQATVACERTFLSGAFEKFGWKVLPSSANFILCRLPQGQSNRRLLSSLLEKGFLLRDAGNFHGLDDSYIRCAVKERSQNESLLNAITGCM